MESYPARFGKKASTIEALAENVTFDINELGYSLSFVPNTPEEGFAIGDAIELAFHGGKNGVAFQQVIANGTVTKISGQKLTVSINLFVSEKEFFEKFAFAAIEKPLENAIGD